MNQETGKFENLDVKTLGKFGVEERVRDLQTIAARLNPQSKPGNRQDVSLAVGEVVEVKGVRFRVTCIKMDGRVRLKMLNAADIAEIDQRKEA